MDEEPFSPAIAAAVADSGAYVSHNLAGQRLGRKGKITRERIIAAALELIDENIDEAFTLTAVARRAGLGMSALYNYFSDQTELLLAALAPVMSTADDAYMAKLRELWPDEELHERALAFVEDYHSFWRQHSGLLHLRNSLADHSDLRMMLHRINSTRPMMGLLAKQMSGGAEPQPAHNNMATVLMTGIERSVTLATDRRLPILTGLPFYEGEKRYHASNARLLELAIRDLRLVT